MLHDAKTKTTHMEETSASGKRGLRGGDCGRGGGRRSARQYGAGASLPEGPDLSSSPLQVSELPQRQRLVAA